MIDGGPWGTTHQHMDRLSFVLAAHGADFLTDPGNTLYANNEPGARLSTLHAGFLHNTLTVNGVDEFVRERAEEATALPLTNRWEQGAAHVLFAGHFDFAPHQPVRWERRLLFVGDAYWLLQDILTGELADAAIEQNFQFETDITVEIEGSRAIATAPNGARLLLLPLGGGLAPRAVCGEEGEHPTWSTQYGACRGPQPMKHGRGWISRVTKSITPAPAVVYAGRVALPAVLTLALVPLPPGAALDALPAITARPDGAATVWRLPHAGGALEVRSSVAGVEVAAARTDTN